MLSEICFYVFVKIVVIALLLQKLHQDLRKTCLHFVSHIIGFNVKVADYRWGG